MKILNYLLITVSCAPVFFSADASAQSSLFFMEDWKEIEAALPVTQEHVANKNLRLALYGPAKEEIKKSNHPNIPNDPFYIWSGECRGNWALTLRQQQRHVDLTPSDARVRIRTRQSGFRELRLILKLADGNWIVSDKSVGFTKDWIEYEFRIHDTRWRRLNIDRVVEGDWVENPDLRRVEEVGFTDLMTGGGTPASSRIDWIEVYGAR